MVLDGTLTKMYCRAEVRTFARRGHEVRASQNNSESSGMFGYNSTVDDVMVVSNRSRQYNSSSSLSGHSGYNIQ